MTETHKRFILHSDKHKEACCNFIKTVPLEILHEVVIREHHKGRTTEQNARLWALLQLVADNIHDDRGAMHGREFWGYKLRCEWGYVVGTCQMKVGGVMVDAPMPKSSTKMDTAEMSEYQEKIINLLIENGVELPEWVD